MFPGPARERHIRQIVKIAKSGISNVLTGTVGVWNGIAEEAAVVDWRQMTFGRLLRRYIGQPRLARRGQRAERRLLAPVRQPHPVEHDRAGRGWFVGESESALPTEDHNNAAELKEQRGKSTELRKEERSGRGSMRFWHAADRPRERLLEKGTEALGDAELLAVLLGSGARGLTALELARSIIRRFGSLAQVLRRSPRDLQDFHGIGAAKASRIAAAFELTARLEQDEFGPGSHIRSPDDIARRFIPLMRRLNHERLYAVLLNAAGQLMREVLVTEGILNQSLVHPREVFRSAISESAAAVIVVHNHPSGSWRPSRHDLEATTQLEDSGAILGIPLVDHIIIAGNRYFSLAQAGLLRSVPGAEYKLRTNTMESSSR